ncbi:phosphatase PAP2 family protein [Arthrobacter sp. zg-Y1219]|nr:phosphatase PAP2 family protein [Arthrobacter sp. zg-Y1219]MDK1361341.1 phosphatase PAP2 family protein [Arthrobacter sp. zg-Y1219]
MEALGAFRRRRLCGSGPAGAVPAVGVALALLLASATGWSRVKLGDHTPTQVLAGHIAGCLTFAAALLLP